MSLPIDREEATSFLRLIIRDSIISLESDKDKALAVHLSRSIELDDELEIIDLSHLESLGYLNSKTDIVKRFDDRITKAIVEELKM